MNKLPSVIALIFAVSCNSSIKLDACDFIAGNWSSVGFNARESWVKTADSLLGYTFLLKEDGSNDTVGFMRIYEREKQIFLQTSTSRATQNYVLKKSDKRSLCFENIKKGMYPHQVIYEKNTESHLWVSVLDKSDTTKNFHFEYIK